jgi:23S rRNA A1618 N6-methylase RlmF
VSKNKYGEYKIDWTDPHAVRELTKVLLDHDFGIKIELPIDRLCPTVTLRMNYILWLQDLMKPHILAQLQQSNAIPSIRGIDIGTGASCIYPLLGVATNNWNFVATEIDDVSLVWAQKNIALNQWQHKIELRKPPPNSILLHIVYPNEQFDFCMCNPPFFASSEEKFVNPHTVCTATESEMSTAGGELAFVSQIIQESLTLRERVRWYTSMIGRKVNVKALLTELHKHQITNIRQVEFVQGKTTRWAIGWSFSQEGLDLIQKEALKERYRDKNKLNMCVKSTDPRVLLTRIEQTLTTAFGFVCTINDINYTIRAILYASAPHWQRLRRLTSLSSTKSTNNVNVEDKVEEVKGALEHTAAVLSLEVQLFQMGSGGDYDVVFKYLFGESSLGHDYFLEVYVSLKTTLNAC